MSLFFGFTVPGFHTELARFRALLQRLPPACDLRRIIEAELERVSALYKDHAVEMLHMLYSGAQRQSSAPQHVCLAYRYEENVLPLTLAGVNEWTAQGAALLEHFVDKPEGNRNTRNARGITLAFLK